MKTSNNEMNSTTSSVKSFKCDCCDYFTSQSNNLTRHKKSKHSEPQLKKGDDDESVLTDDEQPVSSSSKDCRMCINYMQLIEMKDSRIADLEKRIELLEKDTKIAVLETKLDCKDMMVDMSGNFIEKQQHTIDNVLQMKQSQPQPTPKGRPKKADVNADDDDDVLVLPTTIAAPIPKPIKKRALTKEEISMRDYHENMNEIDKKMKTPTIVKSNKPREIDVDYLNEVCSNAEPFENLIEKAFGNLKYFEMSDLTEEQLIKCKMPKNDYYVNHMVKFQDHHLKPSKSKNAIMEHQVDYENKEKFYNVLFLEAFEKQDVKSFYYVKKSRQSFCKTVDGWKMCENEDIENIMKRFERRIFKVATNGANMLKAGAIPSSRYGYEKINYAILNSGKSISEMPQNEKDLLMDLMNQYCYGLTADCNNERMSDMLFKKLKQSYDIKASHNSDVITKYEKENEVCETDAVKNDDEEEKS